MQVQSNKSIKETESINTLESLVRERSNQNRELYRDVQALEKLVTVPMKLDLEYEEKFNREVELEQEIKQWKLQYKDLKY